MKIGIAVLIVICTFSIFGNIAIADNCSDVLNMPLDFVSEATVEEYQNVFTEAIQTANFTEGTRDEKIDAGLAVILKNVPIQASFDQSRKKFEKLFDNYSSSTYFEINETNIRDFVSLTLPKEARVDAINAWLKCKEFERQDVLIDISGSYSSLFSVSLRTTNPKLDLTFPNTPEVSGSVAIDGSVPSPSKVFKNGNQATLSFSRQNTGDAFRIVTHTNHGDFVLFGPARTTIDSDIAATKTALIQLLEEAKEHMAEYLSAAKQNRTYWGEYHNQKRGDIVTAAKYLGYTEELQKKMTYHLTKYEQVMKKIRAHISQLK